MNLRSIYCYIVALVCVGILRLHATDALDLAQTTVARTTVEEKPAVVENASEAGVSTSATGASLAETVGAQENSPLVVDSEKSNIPAEKSGEAQQPSIAPVAAEAKLTESEQQPQNQSAETKEAVANAVEPVQSAPAPSLPSAAAIAESSNQQPLPSYGPTGEGHAQESDQEVVDKEDKVKPIIDQEGLDTLDQEGGNWLLKRKALEDTVDLIEKINKLFIDILKSRMDFLVRRNKADRDSDVFISDIGFELGDLSQMLNTLIEKMEHERAAVGDLTEEEREVLEQLEKKIADLKKLKDDLKTIDALDATVDDVVMQMEAEIDKSNSYQAQAWKNFQAIKKILSDEKATELYLQTEGLYKNLQDISKYLQDTLQNYFNSTIAKQKATMSEVKQTLSQLKEQGLNLQHEVDNFIQETEAIERDLALEKEVEATKKKPVAQKKEGWFGYVSVLWNYPMEKLMSFWDWVMAFFESSPKSQKVTPEKNKQSKAG